MRGTPHSYPSHFENALFRITHAARGVASVIDPFIPSCCTLSIHLTRGGIDVNISLGSPLKCPIGVRRGYGSITIPAFSAVYFTVASVCHFSSSICSVYTATLSIAPTAQSLWFHTILHTSRCLPLYKRSSLSFAEVRMLRRTAYPITITSATGNRP